MNWKKKAALVLLSIAVVFGLGIVAGVQLVRMGEFSWAKMEPAEGKFDFAWLDEAIAVEVSRREVSRPAASACRRRSIRLGPLFFPRAMLGFLSDRDVISRLINLR